LHLHTAALYWSAPASSVVCVAEQKQRPLDREVSDVFISVLQVRRIIVSISREFTPN